MVNVEEEMEVSEDDQQAIDLELEKIQVIMLKKAELVYHEELPFYYETKKKRPTIRKLHRKPVPKTEKAAVMQGGRDGEADRHMRNLGSIKEEEDGRDKDMGSAKKSGLQVITGGLTAGISTVGNTLGSGVAFLGKGMGAVASKTWSVLSGKKEDEKKKDTKVKDKKKERNTILPNVGYYDKKNWIICKPCPAGYASSCRKR
jgi:cobalamin-dependent methionine synthase I